MTSAQRIHKKGLQQGMDQGLQRGVDQGVVQGIDQGIQSMQRKFAEGMIRKGMDKDTMSELLGLTHEQVEALVLEINQVEGVK